MRQNKPQPVVRKELPQEAHPALSAEDIDHIRRLVERDTVGLPQACVRYRRRVAAFRYVVAACLCAVVFVGSDAALSQPLRYAGVVVSGDLTASQADQIVQDMLLGL